MANIQSLGVGSGLDVNAIVTQLLAIEKQPLDRLKKVEAGVQAKISTYGNVRSKLDSLETAAGNLVSTGTWSQTTVDLGGAQEISVTASGTAPEGSTEIEVVQLARKQTTAFRHDGGTFAGAAASTLTVDGRTLTVDVGDSLEDIRDAFNALNPPATGLRAAILNDVDGAVLVFTSLDSGAAASFNVTTSDADLATFLGERTDTSARNLHVKVDGVSLYSATNTLTEAVEGLTITASQVSSSPRTVNVKRDTASIKTKIETFVNSYNDVVSLLRQQTAYNQATKTGGLLQSDRVAVSLQSQIRAAMTGDTGASSLFSRLSDLGISLQQDGKLQIQTTQLEAALDDVDETAKLFSRDDANASLDGVAVRVSDLIGALTDSDGSLAIRQNGLQTELSRNQRDQERASDRLTQIEARLKSQYSALDTKMASLTGLGQYVSQQFQQSNNSQ